MRHKLAVEYHAFLKAVKTEASRQGLTADSLKTYMREAARMRNKDTPTLVRGNRRWDEMWAVGYRSRLDAMNSRVNGVPLQHANDPTSSWQAYIEKAIHENIRNYKDARPYHVVLGE